MHASSVTELLFQQLNFRGERQKVISSNIANIDTPEYKTKNLKFKDTLQKTKEESNLQLAQTHSQHMALSFSDNKSDFEVYEVKGLVEQNDGNNVNLDAQMSEMSKNNVMFSAIQSSIKKDSAWFKTMIDASSKN
ncbi:flagellar basal body rod protein FlgB [Arcobacter sp. 15-2]|uniref:flagellar basal body rod protein FlgB n=1 Tax=Arcobacter sp. 15-2 TaxID=3374109 RepID=UPI00399CA3EB